MSVSIDKIMSCIENPVKINILLFLREFGSATPKEILNHNKEIPQTTLYRTLSNMEKDGIIEVVKETRVRAIIEKTYSLSNDFVNLEESVVKTNDGFSYFKIFSNFMLDLLKKFKVYTKKKDIDIAKDGTSFNAIPVYATSEELSNYSKKIEELFLPAMQKTCNDQNLYTLAIIVAPPADLKKEGEIC